MYTTAAATERCEKRRGVSFVIGCLAFGMAPAAWGADLLTPTEQTRVVDGFSRANDEFYYQVISDEDAAADFEPFESGISAIASVDGASARSDASQDSTIGAGELYASGEVEALGEAWAFDGWADGDALSVYDVTFEVNMPVRARLFGLVTAYDSVYTEVILAGPEQALYAALAFGPDEAQSFDAYFYLEAGEHRLGAFTSASVFGDMDGSDHGLGSYEATLKLCPLGDLDEDGTIGLSDMAELLTYYGGAGGIEEGDLNGDGTVGLGDLALLLANYGSSCSLE